MKKISLNENWRYSHIGEEDWVDIDIPHDAMLSEKRSDYAPGGKNISYFEGRDYLYERIVSVEKKDGEKYILEFEGVYRNAKVLLNGKEVAFRPYGYTNFYVDITDCVLNGDNLLQVKAFNSEQPNSRWYSGSGIYRPVWLYVLPEKHILLNGIKFITQDYKSGKVKVEVQTVGEGEVSIELFDGNTFIDGCKILSNENASCTLHVENPKLWSDETPYLYTLKVNFEGDERILSVGIRHISCDSKNGFTINGRRTILRGACVHHDNGILGACAYDFAEERKIRLLKQAGYNAIRSAHNPCSKALLDACDKLGMIVMDEYVDMWYVHKTMYDYASFVDEWWKKDLKDFVEKDFNHPSVAMYSTGNEVGETSEKRGIELTKKFTAYLHSLDSTRFVTCGINIWFNAMYKMGFGQYSDEKAKKAAEAKTDKAKKKHAVGSEFFNNLAGMVGAEFMKTMAKLPICDRVTKQSYANMDVAGYNYGVKCYKRDLKKYPDRVICGSETFVSDACLFMETAKNAPALIGDFVWTGIDYLGEVGLGAMEYKDYAKDFVGGAGWIAAGCGRLDLTGRDTGEALYTKVVFDVLPIAMAVVPVNHTKDKHSPSAWSMTNARDSWSWNGCAGKKAKVEVYAKAEIIELYVNGALVGRKKANKNCRTIFTTTYQDGKIEALAYNKNVKIASTSLITADNDTVLALEPEQKSVKNGELLYIRLKYTDKNGTVKPLERGNISLKVEGGKLLGLGNACPYNEIGYLTNATDTYFGEALAVIKPYDSAVKVNAVSKFGNAFVVVPVN